MTGPHRFSQEAVTRSYVDSHAVAVVCRTGVAIVAPERARYS